MTDSEPSAVAVNPSGPELHPVADQGAEGGLAGLNVKAKLGEDSEGARGSGEVATIANTDSSKEENEQSRNQSPPDNKSHPTDVSPSRKLSKRLDLVANILEQELEDLRLDTSKDIPPSLSRQIELIRKLAVESRQNQTSRPTDKGDDEEESEDDDEEELACEVKRFSMEEWKQLKGVNGSVMAAYYRTPTTYESVDAGKGQATGLRERQERPLRVSIASNHLIYELEDITDVMFEHFVLAPPYKLLINYYPEIKERVHQLQDRLEQVEKESYARSMVRWLGYFETRQGSSSLSGKAPIEKSVQSDASLSPKQDASDSARYPTENLTPIPQTPKMSTSGTGAVVAPAKKKENLRKKRKELTTRINHLQLLNDFIKTELASYVNLQESIKAGVLEKIAFEDLCYLFQPGQTLFFKKKGYDQLCKAYAVSGGQQRKRAPTQEEAMQRASLHNSTPWIKNDATIMNNSGHGTWSPLTVDHYIMEFDGHVVGPKDGREQIKHYAGERRVTDLPIYPLRFHKQRAEVIQKLTARGKKYISSYGHKSYYGVTCPPNPQVSPEELRGDVFIDVKDYYRSNPRLKPELGVLQRTNPDDAEVEEYVAGTLAFFCDHRVDQKAAENFMLSYQTDLEPVEYRQFLWSEKTLPLFPHQLPAYVFRTRQYVHVDVNVVAEIDKSDEARVGSFEDLVIPESHRSILVGLVKNQVTEEKAEPGADNIDAISPQIDIVRGKGRGLIILLHGPPGSGKTSTAETLAAYTRRPLYPITCGDLGISPREVELALTEHTERAQRWASILLLDEADVFLTRRDWRDTNHNALVSVFLRQLEYYSGILFLTTNRVGVLDEAFKSRIHVSLAYPTIQLQATIEIWEGILNRIERDNKTAAIKTRFDRNALLSFAKNHYKTHEKTGTAWNGRQIRNAFQLAIALGHHERDKKLQAAALTSEEAVRSGERRWMTVKLTKDSFRNVATTARDFEDYLHAVRGHDSDIAKHMSLRHDQHMENDLRMPTTGARKEYGWQQQHLVSPRFARGERSSAFSSSSRDKQRPRASLERRSPSVSRSQRGVRRPRDEEVSEAEEEEESDIFEELSSNED
ncbi:hypothetical protein B0T10DRAFT_496467 [Thelonectria olida]|uniref:AAA+ ATPase domain-containing protein n=1 Tax=Thelonectria olida TaxID=1576542 RepID=A0A9P8VU85_9HYPO|nr:hypothetical protein B0T10DRAFT_496467 [Thelonectria olida]